ncbi:g4485 [Coccomyxa elongata]
MSSHSLATFSRSLQASADYGAVNSAPLEALLALVSQGHALLAEILQLTSSLPPALQPSATKYAPILFDFRYFRDPDAHDQKIESSRELASLDEEFREAHQDVLEQLYTLYRGIVELHGRLVNFLQQLKDGAYIQCSLSTLTLNPEGRQLLLEAVALVGALLLALDRRIDGAVRERSVVAYYRLKGGAQAVGPSVNQVITLVSSTGFQASAKKPPAGYPEAYFARLTLPQEAVMAVIAACRSDDIYHQVVHYPAPEHRTAALAHQAAGLYLALYFVPHVLHRDSGLMRTLVDRHFADNWVVAWGPGLRSDLALEWESFKAARGALGGVITAARAKDMAATFAAALPDLQAQLASFLVEGKLKEEYVLEHMAEVFSCLRSCNVALRWLLLHTAASHRKLCSAVASAAPAPNALLTLLLDTALLEYEVRRGYSVLLESKMERWHAQRRALVEAIQDLAAFYQALQALPRSTSTADLSDWFDHLIEQVEAMDYADPTGTSRSVQSLTIALDDAERFHPPEAALQTKQFLSVIRGHLAHTLRIADVKEELLATLAAVADFAYGWGLLDSYVARLQAEVRGDPRTVLKLRCLFIKMRSLLEVPLLRLGQARAPAVAATSRVYSSALLAFSRRLLQVVPATVGDLLDQMVVVASTRMTPLPPRLEVARLRDAAQLPQRAHLAALAHRIAAFADGMRAMEKTFVGVVELQPTRLLEDGLRAHLAQRAAAAAATAMSFSNPPAPLAYPPLSNAGRSAFANLFGAGASLSPSIPGRQDLCARLGELAGKLQALRDAFEAVQDLVDLPGMRVWHTQLQRVISTNLTVELRRLRRVVESGMTSTSGRDSQDPELLGGSKDELYGEPATFLGRLVGELLRLSDPVRTQYQPLLCAWHDGGGGEVLGMAAFDALAAAFDGPGLRSAAALLAARTHQTVCAGLTHIRSELDAGWRTSLSELREVVGSPFALPEGGPQVYAESVRAAIKQLHPLPVLIASLGQMQLLQQRISHELASFSRLEGDALLHCALENLNAAVLSDAKAAASGSTDSSDPPTSPVTPLQPDLADLFEAAGLSNPLEKVYERPAALPELPDVLFLVLFSLLDAYGYKRRLALLERLDRRAPDSVALAAGFATLLRQFHPCYADVFLHCMRQCIQMYVQTATGAVAQGVQAAGIDVALPSKIGTLVAFVESVAEYGGMSHSLMHQYVPPFIADTWLSVLQ